MAPATFAETCIRLTLLVTLTLASSLPAVSWASNNRRQIGDSWQGSSLPGISGARAPQFESTALLTPQPTSFAQCPQFFANGRPPALAPRPQLRELCYEAFAVLHSGTTRTPVFVAQRLNRQSIEDADEKRAKRFFADARLPSSERAELEDYKNSGYSRGHMAPAGDMPTPSAMVQSFSLANVVPQNAQHNGGAWAKIEQDTRHYVRRAKGDVFVITGPSSPRTHPRLVPME